MKNKLVRIFINIFIIVITGFISGCNKLTEEKPLQKKDIVSETPESLINKLFMKYSEAMEKNEPNIISDICCDSVGYDGKELMKNEYANELIKKYEENKYYDDKIEINKLSDDRFKINYEKHFDKNQSAVEKSFLVIDKINEQWRIILDFNPDKLKNIIKPENNFFKQQLEHQKVKETYNEYYEIIKYDFQKKNLNYPPEKIFIRVLKESNDFEIWMYSKDTSKYNLFKKYDICFHSGTSGPKRAEGDKLVPEGYYYINDFNPDSKYYLSLGINYPNESDKILSNKESPGNDIYIHGYCVSIGCLAMTNERIKEIYLIAALAHGNGQEEIPVHIFPVRLTDENLIKLKNQYGNNREVCNFWDNIK